MSDRDLKAGAVEAWLHRRDGSLGVALLGGLLSGLLCFLGPLAAIPAWFVAVASLSLARTCPRPRLRGLFRASAACTALYSVALLVSVFFGRSGLGATRAQAMLSEIVLYGLLVFALAGLASFALAMRGACSEAGLAPLARRWSGVAAWTLGALGAVLLALALEPWLRDRWVISHENGRSNPERIPLLLLSFQAWSMVLAALSALRSTLRREEHAAWSRARLSS